MCKRFTYKTNYDEPGGGAEIKGTYQPRSQAIANLWLGMGAIGMIMSSGGGAGYERLPACDSDVIEMTLPPHRVLQLMLFTSFSLCVCQGRSMYTEKF